MPGQSVDSPGEQAAESETGRDQPKRGGVLDGDATVCLSLAPQTGRDSSQQDKPPKRDR